VELAAIHALDHGTRQRSDLLAVVVPQAAQVCLLFLGQRRLQIVAAVDAAGHLADKPLRVRSDAENATAQVPDHDGERFILPN
jgi:hypothetical protein